MNRSTFKIGEFVEYAGFVWMTYTFPRWKTRRDGCKFEAVALVKPFFGYHDVVYPRDKMHGVYMSSVRKLSESH